MVEIRSYTIEELEDLTSFNQRTIAYYIQQGLLPKVGRRGRNTRYPQLFLNRLRFIQRVRELQDSGRLGSVTLPRIARVIWHLVEGSGEMGKLPDLDDRQLQELFEDESIPDERVLGETQDGDQVTVKFGKFGPYVRAAEIKASIDADEFNSIDLAEALNRINEKAEAKEQRIIREFKEEGIQVLNGRFGPYVKRRGTNAKIPRDLDPSRLTVEQCEALLEKRRNKEARKSASKRRDALSSKLGTPRIAENHPVASAQSPKDEMIWHAKKAPQRELNEPITQYMGNHSFSHALERADLDFDALSFSSDAEEFKTDSLEAYRQQAQHLANRIEAIVNGSHNDRGRVTEHWTRVPLTEHIEILVKGIEPEHAMLIESLAKTIRSLLGIEITIANSEQDES